MSQTLDQARSRFSWERTKEPMEGGQADEYKNLTAGAPAMIMSNGLMQTMAYWQAKKGAAHASLLQTVIDWLATAKVVEVRQGAGFDQFIEILHGTDGDTYMRCTDETLALLRWVRQFAKVRG